MPGLRHSLGLKDYSLLLVIGEMWGIKAAAESVDQLIDILAENLSREDLFNTHYNNLNEEEKNALLEIFHAGIGLPWSLFIRRFGEFREMGVSRINREQPYRHPISVVEKLWYQGLIARDFFKTEKGIEEFVYIPDEFKEFLEQAKSPRKSILGIPATAKDIAKVRPASDSLVDLSCTLLAGIRAGVTDVEYQNHWEAASQFIRPLSIDNHKILLIAADLLELDGRMVTLKVGDFLAMERGKAHAHLVHSWLESSIVKEMEFVPDFRVEGEWYYDPIATRKTVLNLLLGLPCDRWWSLLEFINSVKSFNPDYLRSAGEYNSWLIRSTHSGKFLRGYQHWDDVDGNFLHFMITGPIHWLGLVDLAYTEHNKEIPVEQVTAFRLSCRAIDLIKGEINQSFPEESEEVLIRSNGYIYAPKGTPRRIRYQVARFTYWEKLINGSYSYRLTAKSVTRGKHQGLSINQMISILKSATDRIPPTLLLALERWDKHGLQLTIQKVSVLRVSRPEIIQSLIKSNVSRYLGDPLGSAAIVIKPGGEEKIKSALLEMGFLVDFEID